VIVVNLITGLHSPAGLVVSRNTLFVANELSGTVGKYNATTGKAINANFITGLKAPIGIAVK
jgi:DNA-binding beta-propeller fold protein YncE